MNDITGQPQSSDPRLPLEPMDPTVRCIQPGGGFVMRLELAWGTCRRFCLRTFRKPYVARMRESRVGDPTGVPHEVLDPRDLKFYRNQTDCHWRPADDPFTWRDRLPFARVGLAELMFFTLLFWAPAMILAIIAANLETAGWVLRGAQLGAVVFALLGLEVAWFFRNPRRQIPTAAGEVVSPADGKVVRVAEIENEFVGPAIEIRIFLSVFNVHINRAPIAARVIGLTYKPGQHRNALFPESAEDNEQLAIRIEQTEAPYRRMIVRQIAGAIARRIVCWLKPGDHLARGEQFGMIKFGSTTDLVLPREPGLTILVKVGDTIQAGSAVVARYSAAS